MKAIIEQLKKETKVLLSSIGLKTGTETVIGLDLGSRYFRAVRIERSGSEVSIKDSLVKEIEHLEDLNSDMKIDTDDKVFINFSGDNLTIRRASIPIMPKEEIEEALRWELKDEVQFDISKAKIKFNILGERELEDGSKRIDLIAIVYKEKDIEEKIRELRGLGLNIQGVFSAEVSLACYVSHSNIISPQEKVGVVDIGNVKTAISIIENGRVSFARDIPIGGDSITEAMTEILNLKDGKIEFSKEQAEKVKCEQGIREDDMNIFSMMRPVLEKLSNQIKSSLDYYTHRFNSKAIQRIILAGGGSRLKGLKEYLSKKLGIEVLDVLPDVSCAHGLALLSDLSLNMIPEAFKEKKKATLEKISLRMISMVGLMLLVLSYTFLSIKAVNLKSELEIYNSYWESVKDLRDIKERIAVFNYAIDKVSYKDILAGDIMRELSNILPSFVILENLVIKNTEPNIKLSGVILKEESLSRFMSILEDSAMFEKVKLVYSKKSEDPSIDSLDFEIRCNYGYKE